MPFYFILCRILSRFVPPSDSGTNRDSQLFSGERHNSGPNSIFWTILYFLLDRFNIIFIINVLDNISGPNFISMGLDGIDVVVDDGGFDVGIHGDGGENLAQEVFHFFHRCACLDFKHYRLKIPCGDA